MDNFKKQGNAKVKKFYMLLLALLVLAIPIGFLFSIVGDREKYRNEAVEVISQSWAGEQVLKAPQMTVRSKVSESKGDEYLYLDDYNADITINTELRKKGIFKIPVYTAQVKVKGTYVLSDNKCNDAIALLSFDVSDSKGFIESPQIKVGNENMHPVEDKKYYTHINPAIKRIPFEYSYTLRGVNTLYVEPKGNITNIKITGNWQNPGFEGDFLPSKREVNKNNFTAEWSIPKIATTGITNDSSDIIKAGVSLLTPVDNYRMALRSVKYAFLFLILTFMAYFTFEITSKKNNRIHPIQYLMIGAAMLIFYLLLTSTSEFMPFGCAYTFSAMLTIGLIGSYTHFVLTKKENKQFSLLITGLLIVLYGFLYTLLVLQDLSMIIGSFVLFIAIAIVMYATRNVEWYEES